MVWRWNMIGTIFAGLLVLAVLFAAAPAQAHQGPDARLHRQHATMKLPQAGVAGRGVVACNNPFAWDHPCGGQGFCEGFACCTATAGSSAANATGDQARLPPGMTAVDYGVTTLRVPRQLAWVPALRPPEACL